MLERKDQLELLAFIEGELDAAQVTALRGRLAREPRVLAIIDRMREDRANLRSVPEAPLPRDFLIDLESYLARPMLIETGDTASPLPSPRPGEFRRQHRRRTRRIRWSRLAAAAVVLFALIAGTWAAINGVVLPRAGQRDTVAASREPSAPPVNVMASVDPRPLEGTIHHYLPDFNVVENRTRMAAVPPARADAGDSVFALDFALIMHTRDVATTESMLIAAAREVHSSVAVVRNFSYAEAQHLASDVRLNEGERALRDSAPMTASGTIQSLPNQSAKFKALADGVRKQWNALPGRMGNASAHGSGQLAGAENLAPSLEQQLEYSSRGATHTMAIPAARLRSFLEALAIAEGQSTALRMLPSPRFSLEDNQPLSSTPLSMWLTEMPQVRASMDRVARRPAETTVLLPVIIQK